ncbi:MAG: hypothetical protein OEM47_00370 [Deltaproteobacteria bacterium]|nr:hypothetical protein [Deltaproteobacteria bacterium]
MADRIRKAEYYKLETPDKPGEGARVLKVLRDAKVSLVAFTAFPRGRKTQMDFVPRNGAAFRKAMKRAGLRVSAKKTVFLIQGGDRVGAIHKVMDTLGKAGINATAIDAVTDGKGHYGALLWVKAADVRKAAKVLGAS